MELLFKLILKVHIITGFISLLLFWIPIFLKKGSAIHVKIGKAYVKLMWTVVFTAALLSIKNIYIGYINIGLFLGFIALITANPLWYGISALKHKKEVPLSYKRKHFAFRISIVLFSSFLICYAIYLNTEGFAILMLFFGILGLFEIPSIIKMIKIPISKINGLKDHIIGMCTSGIAAYTAFFVFGARQFLDNLLPSYLSIIPWILPTLIGTVGIRMIVKKYIQ